MITLLCVDVRAGGMGTPDWQGTGAIVCRRVAGEGHAEGLQVDCRLRKALAGAKVGGTYCRLPSHQPYCHF